MSDMAVAFSDSVGTINQSDTAELYEHLYVNEQPVTADQVISCVFTIQLPDGTSSTHTGSILTDGTGFFRFTGTTEIGYYIVQAQFTLVTGEIRSVMDSFTVIDPFNPPVPTDIDLVVDQVMLRLEDTFDSMDGGPWLRDKSFANFDYTKIEAFIAEALLDINIQMPPTNFDITLFTTPVNGNLPNPNMPLLVKGVLVLTIRHLMRSYVEQPVLTGAQLFWEDRTRYTTMWKAVYDVEYADYIAAVRLWKRTTLNLGNSALLTFNKAGRLFPYASQRSRGIGRGYY